MKFSPGAAVALQAYAVISSTVMEKIQKYKIHCNFRSGRAGKRNGILLPDAIVRIVSLLKNIGGAGSSPEKNWRLSILRKGGITS